MDLRAEAVTPFYKGKRRVQSIYASAFNKEDRMPFSLMLMMAMLPSTEFSAFHDGEELCGFVYMATKGNLSFIMFFAVDESLRSQGYGSRILSAVQSAHPQNKLIVTIERCDEQVPDMENRLRRKKFYAANGFAETGYLVKLGGQKQEVLVKNGEFDVKEFRLFFLMYSNFTMLPKLIYTGANH